jgi:hypothetical protein
MGPKITMKEYSLLDKETLFLHRTYIQNEGKWHEYFFGSMEASKSAITAYIVPC